MCKVECWVLANVENELMKGSWMVMEIGQDLENRIFKHLNIFLMLHLSTVCVEVLTVMELSLDKMYGPFWSIRRVFLPNLWCLAFAPDGSAKGHLRTPVSFSLSNALMLHRARLPFSSILCTVPFQVQVKGTTDKHRQNCMRN
ncbi:hypothetical protein Peur_009228 [Populus x canadensis]